MKIASVCLCMLLIGGSAAAAADDSLFDLQTNFRTDTRFNDFISPMTNPVFFEDPRMLTEARFIFANHSLPDTLAGGGDLQLYALQLRARLTENLSFIATKDGFFVSDNAVTDDGWADLAAGLKLNLWSCPEEQFLLSTGFTFEFPTGQTRALQGNGHGEFNLFVTGGWEILENVHWLSAAGVRLPSDRNDENQSGVG
ncbi:MAG: transporter [Planctomycetaceae bacterium]